MYVLQNKKTASPYISQLIFLDNTLSMKQDIVDSNTHPTL